MASKSKGIFLDVLLVSGKVRKYVTYMAVPAVLYGCPKAEGVKEDQVKSIVENARASTNSTLGEIKTDLSKIKGSEISTDSIRAVFGEEVAKINEGTGSSETVEVEVLGENGGITSESMSVDDLKDFAKKTQTAASKEYERLLLGLGDSVDEDFKNSIIFTAGSDTKSEEVVERLFNACKTHYDSAKKLKVDYSNLKSQLGSVHDLKKKSEPKKMNEVSESDDSDTPWGDTEHSTRENVEKMLGGNFVKVAVKRKEEDEVKNLFKKDDTNEGTLLAKNSLDNLTQNIAGENASFETRGFENGKGIEGIKTNDLKNVLDSEVKAKRFMTVALAKEDVIKNIKYVGGGGDGKEFTRDLLFVLAAKGEVKDEAFVNDVVKGGKIVKDKFTIDGIDMENYDAKEFYDAIFTFLGDGTKPEVKKGDAPLSS